MPYVDIMASKAHFVGKGNKQEVSPKPLNMFNSIIQNNSMIDCLIDLFVCLFIHLCSLCCLVSQKSVILCDILYHWMKS